MRRFAGFVKSCRNPLIRREKSASLARVCATMLARRSVARRREIARVVKCHRG
jgi:hypothetical protein